MPDNREQVETLAVQAKRFRGSEVSDVDDVLAVEEPLEIHVSVTVVEDQPSSVLSNSVQSVAVQSIAVTMRTPGADKELAAGFLFTEGIISRTDQIEEIINDKSNVVIVALKAGVELDPRLFERHSFVASSCGVCGKKSIAAVKVKRLHQSISGMPLVSAQTIHNLSASMRDSQANFNSTGGIHASALFDSLGTLLLLREDVGRHNALDKVIGSQFLQDKLPLNESILMVSGRASFELVQKASHAGIPVLVAVGAPSSLAVSLAQECGMTLIGFARDGRFNVYSAAERIDGVIK
ncbi:formate dehydrogenase accessory sulfurtransferase FdhD [bacterium]|nr:formate dehydrogenase accessory sulfurtransferase FdhD [bacterium]MBP9809136.1 formate dehydrogenase accessory sulfurtransferase FdhD [bacterium]